MVEINSSFCCPSEKFLVSHHRESTLRGFPSEFLDENFSVKTLAFILDGEFSSALLVTVKPIRLCSHGVVSVNPSIPLEDQFCGAAVAGGWGLSHSLASGVSTHSSPV